MGKSEKDHIQWFLKHIGIPSDTLKLIEQDPPDFELLHKNQLISIEHTRIFVRNGEEIKKHYLASDEILNLAEKKYLKGNHPTISVHLDLGFPLNIKGNNKKRLLNELVDFIISKIPDLESNGLGEVKFESFSESLPEFITFLEIVRYKGIPEGLWRKTEMIWSGEAKPEEIIPPIDKKNNRMLELEYQKNYTQNWLVLVSEEKHWSAFATYKPRNFKPDPDWEFDRIYVSADGFAVEEIYRKL